MKVGDRVRINRPESQVHGKEGVIWRIEENGDWVEAHLLGQTAYGVRINGLPDYVRDCGWRAFERHELIPIQPTGTWEETFNGTKFDIRNGLEVKC